MKIHQLAKSKPGEDQTNKKWEYSLSPLETNVRMIKVKVLYEAKQITKSGSLTQQINKWAHY